MSQTIGGFLMGVEGAGCESVRIFFAERIDASTPDKRP